MIVQDRRSDPWRVLRETSTSGGEDRGGVLPLMIRSSFHPLNGVPMQKFKNGQRVRINNPLPLNAGMNGWVGTVVRLRRADDAAWVNMTRNLPLSHQSFPEDDDRNRHLMLWPDECKPVEPLTRP